VRGPVADWSASKPRRPEVAGCGQTEEAAIRAATDERKEEDVIKRIWNHGATMLWKSMCKR
jgi:hypothetical protein